MKRAAAPVRTAGTRSSAHRADYLAAALLMRSTIERDGTSIGEDAEADA